VADLTDANGIHDVVGAITIDVLVNNAGLAIADDVTDPAVLQQHLDVNVFGPYNVTRAALPALIAAHGSIINVLSIAALAPAPASVFHRG
jgi:NAD(P)-dependent dehydrogenase (short-subunit alcohol dehydrogenase family)